MHGTAWGILGVVAALMSALLPAQAGCYSDCLGHCWMSREASSYSCTTRSGYCSAKCLSGGETSRSYGAIAYSPTTRVYGYSLKFASRAAAEKRARTECGKSDCEIATWYYNSCGAVAAATNGSWGGSNGSNEQRARAQAQARCAREGGVDCKVVHAACSR